MVARMTRTLPQHSYAATGGGFDRCWTPPNAWWILRPYIPLGTRIWECAAGAGWLARWMREDGYHVIESDVTQGQDYRTYEPDEAWDMAITNLPFSLTRPFLERAESFGKPFAFIVPYSAQYSAKAKKIRGDSQWWEIRPNRRINYHMPDSGYHNNGAQMMTVWLTKGILTSNIDVDLPDPPPEHRLIKPAKKRKPSRADILRWVRDEGARTPEQITDLIMRAMKGQIPMEEQAELFLLEAA